MPASPSKRDDAPGEHTGTLEDWNDARGFGFIRTTGGERIFVHVSDIASADQRPGNGDRVVFRVGPGRQGRPAAKHARVSSSVSNRQRRGLPGFHPLWFGWRIGLAGAVALLVFANIVLANLPLWVALVYGGASILSFIQYARDKQAAMADRWRISEAQLLGVDLVGGLLGGLLAQEWLRHKTVKPGFVHATQIIAGLHLLCLGGLVGDWITVADLADLLEILPL